MPITLYERMSALCMRGLTMMVVILIAWQFLWIALVHAVTSDISAGSLSMKN